MSRNDKPRQNRRRSVAQQTANAEPAPSIPSWRTRLILERERLKHAYAKVATPLAHAGRLTVLIAVAAGAVAAGRLVEQHVRRAKAFETTVVEIEGAQRLSRDQVLAAAGLAVGKNVFDVSPEQAEERLRTHPFVAEAAVTRRLPGSYKITLREQELAAVLQVGEQLLLVGQDASVLKVLEPGDPVDVPVITGADEGRWSRDVHYRATLLENAVLLLHEYREAGLWAAERVSEIHVEPDLGLSLYVGQDATAVRLGKAPYAKKLRRLRGIFDKLERDDARPLYVYLDNERRPDRATVRLR
jgi:cell division protein FtsQ